MGRPADHSENFIKHLKPLQGALEAYCLRWLNDRNSVEDVLQEAIFRAFRDFDLFAEGTNFRAWIFKYLNLGILETNRRLRKRRTEPLTDEVAEIDSSVESGWELEFDDSLLKILMQSPEVVLEQCEDALSFAIQQLRPVDRSVLLLKAIGDFKYREIAEIVDIPLGTVMSSLARARQRVRHELMIEAREQGCLGHREQKAKGEQ